MEKDSDEDEEIKNITKENGIVLSAKIDSLEEFLQEPDSLIENNEKSIIQNEEENKNTKLKLNEETESRDQLDTLEKYGNLVRFGFFCILSYLVGYFGWSILWIIIGLITLTLYLKKKHKKKEKTYLAYDIATRGEQKALECRFSQLPSWVQFSDINRVEWINTMISIIWPQVSYFMDHFLRRSVEPLAREALEQYKLWDFKFQQIDFGKIPPRLCGIKVQGDQGSSEMIVDVDFEYNGDIDVSISVLKITSSVADVQIQGRVRIVLKPIIEDIPFIVYFRPPEIDFDLGGAASILDLPGLNSVIKQSLNEYIEMYAVLPNKINILLSDKISPLELKMPQPVGLVVVEVIEAKGLPSNLDLLTSIDPYVVIRHGAFELQTSVKSGSNPVWNEKLYFPIEVPEFQELNLTVFDRDVGSADDFSGSTKINIQSIVKEGKIDEWIPLENVPTGSIHLKLSWSQVRPERPENGDTSILLCVFLDSVSVGPRYSSRPNLRVNIKAGEYSIETQNIFHGEKNPKFHEGFIFFIDKFDDNSGIKLTIFDDRKDINVSSGVFSIVSVASTTQKNLKTTTYKLNDNESTASFAAQIRYLDNSVNSKLAESVQALLSSRSKRLVKGLGNSATGAARDVSGYAKNMRSATGIAIKNLGTVASNKTKNLSTTLRKWEDANEHEKASSSTSLFQKDNSISSEKLPPSGTPKSFKDQMRAFLRL